MSIPSRNTLTETSRITVGPVSGHRGPSQATHEMHCCSQSCDSAQVSLPVLCHGRESDRTPCRMDRGGDGCTPLSLIPQWHGCHRGSEALSVAEQLWDPQETQSLLVLLSLQGSRRSSPGPHWTQAAGFRCVDGFVLMWVTWPGLPSARIPHPSRFVSRRPWHGLPCRVACLAAYILFIFHLPRSQPSQGQVFGASGVPMCLSCQAHNRHSVSTS